jgi:hypothetical protein
LVEKPHGKYLLARPKGRQENNIKAELKHVILYVN